jgi:hypothetical protein
MEMKISLDNYEEFFLDYLDGRLDSEQLSELSLFLNLHAELKHKLCIPENTILKPDMHVYQHKSLIKKLGFEATIDESNFENFCIAYYEHNLSEEKEKQLISYCSYHPDKQKDFDVIQSLSLKPDVFSYKHKNTLYRRPSQKRSFTVIALRYASLAASVAVLLAVYINYKPVKTIAPNTLASVTSNVSNEPKIKVIHPIKTVNNFNKKELYSIIHSKQALAKVDTIPNTDYATTSLRVPEIQKQIPLPELKLIKTNNTIFLKDIQLDQVSPLETQLSNTNSLASSNNVLKAIGNKLSNLNGLISHNKKISLFKIAQLGIKGINTLTDSNMTLTEKTDSTRNITALSFESDLLKYHSSRSN